MQSRLNQLSFFRQIEDHGNKYEQQIRVAAVSHAESTVTAEAGGKFNQDNQFECSNSITFDF